MTSIDVKRGLEIPAGGANKAGPFVAAGGKSGRAFNWFFADKERLFWTLQAFGWLGFLFLHLFSISPIFGGGRTPVAFGYSVVQSLVGFLTTSILMRPIFRFARRQDPATLLVIALSTTIAMAIAMTTVKSQAFDVFFGNEWFRDRVERLGTDNFFLVILPDIPINFFLLLSWAGFYFGINYYLTLRNETERALVAARLADQAQLKMLRYQLNPHFLFNTLNAISTLVLERDGKNANDMLTRLSAFLRYSLDSDPLQKTTLAEELRALQLYLDIEKTRFCDRLDIEFNVGPDVLGALVPSLILQPAIENAIKYAIAQMESGGKILIVAKKEGDMLVLQVCDNGPNAPADPDRILDNAATGVGLVNMRDRLAHLYGGRQSFRLSR
ncbi:MAG TPA: histidine kinase, partial [Parvularculaceae bacterium]|nr:histidine kinase [Parvularculaceae bacterium]